MSDRFTSRIRNAALEGRPLRAADAQHLATCAACSAARHRAMELDAGLDDVLRAAGYAPLPADPRLATGDRSSLPGFGAAIALAAVAIVAVLGIRGLVVLPGTSATPSASTVPTASAAVEAIPIAPGTLARVTAAAAVTDAPAGSRFAELEQDQLVLVTGVHTGAEATWYRIEFEFCCRPDLTGYQWVFGWVAGDLSTASPDQPLPGVDPTAGGTGPTLEPTAGSCPTAADDLYRIAEPVRATCTGGREVELHGVLTGYSSGTPPYAGEAAWLTGMPLIGLAPAGLESGNRLLPLRLPPDDQQLLAWLTDDRVRRGEPVTVIGTYGVGATPCALAPQAADLPPFSATEQAAWCAQQFVVQTIHASGADAVLGAPLPDPAWRPPLDAQPESGDVWQLLASATANQVAITVKAGTVDWAADPEAYRRLWLSVASGEAPAVDFARQFVVRFVPAVSGSCPWIAFTGLGVHDEVLYGEFLDLPADIFVSPVPSSFGCTTDAQPHAFLVAVDRSMAPATRFTLRVHDEIRCGCADPPDEVRVDLSSP